MTWPYPIWYKVFWTWNNKQPSCLLFTKTVNEGKAVDNTDCVNTMDKFKIPQDQGKAKFLNEFKIFGTK